MVVLVTVINESAALSAGRYFPGQYSNLLIFDVLSILIVGYLLYISR